VKTSDGHRPVAYHRGRMERNASRLRGTLAVVGLSRIARRTDQGARLTAISLPRRGALHVERACIRLAKMLDTLVSLTILRAIVVPLTLFDHVLRE
jgi:hypothetical protein